MLYLLKTKIKYSIESAEFEELCIQVAQGQSENKKWVWKIWGHNPEKKTVEIISLMDNEEDLKNGIEFIEYMKELYGFVIENVTHEEFKVMKEPSRITNAPLS